MTVATLNIPPGVPSDGTVAVWFVPEGGLANYQTPAATEVSAVTAQALAAHLFGIGQGGETARKEKRRLGSKVNYEILGSTTYTIEDLSYVYDVQNPTSETHAAYTALVPFTKGHFVVRWGVDAAEDPAVGDVVDVIPVRFGPQIKQQPEETDELTVSQAVSIIGTPAIDVALT